MSYFNMAQIDTHLKRIETEPEATVDNERLDCGHYEYLSRATATPGGALLCQACTARLWLLRNAPEQPIVVEEEPRHTWRDSLQRLFTALR